MAHEVPVAATGLLREFAEARLISAADFHLARRMASYAGESDPRAELAFALTARELRLGSVCLHLPTAHTLPPEGQTDEDTGLPAVEWPDPASWLDVLRASPAVASADDATHLPFRLVDDLLYLDRFFEEERQVAGALLRRSALAALPAVATATPAASGQPGMQLDADQAAAVEAVLGNRTTVITGGPGTGKTTIVGAFLSQLATGGDRPVRVALAAPTGKAASRLLEAVTEALGSASSELRLWSGTLHSLVGMVPFREAPQHHRDNTVPHDVVVVDETSMVSLSTMRLLLDAVDDETRLVLVGDPQQLASVDAGAVLADIAASPRLVTSDGGSAVMPLRTNHRSDQAISQLADAIRDGDAASARQLLAGEGACSLHPFDGTQTLAALPHLAADVEQCARAVVAAAGRGEAREALEALGTHRLLCAHRDGRFGVSWWNQQVRRHLARLLPGYAPQAGYWVGQPLLLTRNAPPFHNGDTAVIIQLPEGLRAAVDQPGEPAVVPPQQLEAATDLHAMTIHKSQGSQFDQVSVVLPPVGSPLLTRELIYTAVTRARRGVRLYGSPEALGAAIETPVRRASGLHRY